MEELSVICRTEDETVAFAQKLSQIAKVGDTFALFGTLGMGKSVFARGFVQSLTAAEEVPSPTFTLVQSYEAPDFEIYHFDLYRLKAPEEIFELGMEEALYGGVCLIEWPEKMAGWLPENCFKLTITPDAFGRRITISSASAEKLSRLRKLELR